MNQAEYKIRNLESQILYLQQEHSNTLKLLHNEIKDLQMKNSETSLQLAMLHITTKESDLEVQNESADMKLMEQITSLQSEIEKLNTDLNLKVAQLEEHNTNFRRLTETIAKLKERHKADISALETELTSKSADIAHLSTMLLKSQAQSKTISLTPGDSESLSQKNQFVVQAPINPKTFKFRNQISVHPDNVHLRRRPIIARQTMVSTSVPITSMVSQPSFPEYAISVEDRTSFSKSIRRPSVLPPIQSSRNNRFSLHSSQDSLTDQSHTSIHSLPSTIPLTDQINKNDTTTTFSHLPSDQKKTHVEVDRLMDINNSSLIQPVSQTAVNWNVTKKGTS